MEVREFLESREERGRGSEVGAEVRGGDEAGFEGGRVEEVERVGGWEGGEGALWRREGKKEGECGEVSESHDHR